MENSICVQPIEYLLDLIAKRGQLMLRGEIDFVYHDFRVVVDQYIAECRRITPTYFRMLFSKFHRHTFDRFPDNLEAANHGILGLGIASKVLDVLILDVFDNVIRRFENIPQVHAQVARLFHMMRTLSRFTDGLISSRSAPIWTKSTVSPSNASCNSRFVRTKPKSPTSSLNRTRISISLSGVASPRAAEPNRYASVAP